MFPSSSRRQRSPTPEPSVPNGDSDSESDLVERRPIDYDPEIAEEHRAAYRLQGKPGYERVLDALRREQTSLREARQYLFGRLLNLQLEEAVLRDHLNARVNDGRAGERAEVEKRETSRGGET